MYRVAEETATTTPVAIAPRLGEVLANLIDTARVRMNIAVDNPQSAVSRGWDSGLFMS